jgi:hypothetical protein
LSSFKDLNKEQLLAAADEFGTEIDKRWGEGNIIAALLSDGVTWEMYKTAFPDTVVDSPEPEQKPAKPEGTAKKFSGKERVELMKMERNNPSYQVLGYRFTKDHPFALVKADDVNWIMSHEVGFRVATPQEAEAFYK